MGRAFLATLILAGASVVGCSSDRASSPDAAFASTREKETAFTAYAMNIQRQIDRATDPSPLVKDATNLNEQLLSRTVDTLEQRRQIHLTNISNAETLAYKRVRVIQNGAEELNVSVSFDQGPMENTGRQLDVAIGGEGLLMVQMKEGVAFTRSGNLFLNADGDLVVGMKDGPRILPALNFPASTTDVNIAEDGSIEATVAGSNTPTPVGRLELSRFVNPSGLQTRGTNLFLATKESGEPITSNPGEDGAGEIRQNFLEGSNVDLIKERVALIRIERQLELVDRLLARYEQNAPVVASGQ